MAIDVASVTAVQLFGDDEWYYIEPGSFEIEEYAFGEKREALGEHLASVFTGGTHENENVSASAFRFIPMYQEDGKPRVAVAGPVSAILAVRYLLGEES